MSNRVSTPPALTSAEADGSTSVKPFSPDDWPIAWMARAERQHARNATALLAPLGLHHREFRLLALLNQGQDLGTGELAELAVLERSTVSKMLSRLTAEGWVQRREDAQDRRRSSLALTPAGRALLDAATPRVESLFGHYQRASSAADRALFLRQLRGFFAQVQGAQGQPLDLNHSI